ncbi:MBL fold metallo-hydrolase [bacterium (Candidatus Blackallbacteria) CG17_big_fil_post_rev_8_21_14_2_50_48_46]|uniref:MBL fold metallo-hydrolase n=1 Tax=bacterium (Candidatus Blackallbacteria) CG17_big_fil_post_rev_8_21_14_2_50_48_46 TaxID=2014261 RepID=A0A2M7G8F0_9BACT|nr:MAG: MBL fold metallo-hydrolase [bacterium (Candidatus Blackallbacteria) CG18_big_fil_WC_8_21_14_2_50_49_26]PIW18390.1 MAG: MBL fold metallo-hydrolase [bacterium (Candidatus Blackallbacteria) CG17_big_fil_post_rev_8_21_14_2_50_48_46]PIW50549.1 MAG: MBL fold metallo-hydrolase [bacterium (Candidatus Blackallbacteria) CG13_big_fil_rev_8_21_14_2_50_49_14]
MLKLSLLKGGYCTHRKNMVLRGASSETCQFPSMFALIEHPQQGYLLFDTGYSTRFFEETRTYPAKLYAQLTPVFLKPEETAKAQLESRGISPEQINTILISHFHGDHVTGLRDFPKARLVCLKSGYEKVRALRGLSATRMGFLPGLLPDDFEKRALLIDRENSPLRVAAVEPFAYTYDLFGDQSILLIPLEGHFAGQMGVLLKLESEQRCFLIADACWLKEGWQNIHLPHPVAMAIMNDRVQYKQDLIKIRAFHEISPETQIIPSHCTESLEAFILKQAETVL